MRIFLTSDSVLASETVSRILELQGHEVQQPANAGAGALLARGGWTADAVVGAFFAGRPPRQRFGAMSVELGIALGRRVPVLVVSKPSLLLSFLSGTPRVDYEGDDDLLATQLELFLDGVRMTSEGRDRADDDQAYSPSLPRETSEPASLRVGRYGALEFERRVHEMLASTGISVLQEDTRDARADFTMYFPNHATDLGVVLVEVKSYGGDPTRPDDPGRRRSALRHAAKKLSEYVLATGAGLGVVVYDGSPLRVPATPLTVAVSVEELASQLENRPLADVLIRARNEAIHAL